MSSDLFIAVIFLAFWISLAIVLGFGFVWMRNQERDTLLDQEIGREPVLEVLGAGRINRRQWSYGRRSCRITVYDDFFVISVSSQRLRIPLYSIRQIDLTDNDRQMTLKGFTEDETLLSLDFRGPDAARLATYLREHGRGLKVANGA